MISLCRRIVHVLEVAESYNTFGFGRAVKPGDACCPWRVITSNKVHISLLTLLDWRYIRAKQSIASSDEEIRRETDLLTQTAMEDEVFAAWQIRSAGCSTAWAPLPQVYTEPSFIW